MSRTCLTPTELALGVPLGFAPDSPALPEPPPLPDPLAALEHAARRALSRPPCLVSFSGGRDSSAVLAVAARVARREGLPLPVPCTARFRGAPRAEEAAWQEAVVRHLELRDWRRLEFVDELDLVGPVAGPLLERHGVLWPPNTHFHDPILQVARGGALLTGIDGDGLLGAWRHRRAADVLARRAPLRRSDLLRLAERAAPPVALRLAHRAARSPAPPWLRPTAARRIARVVAADRATEPKRWRDWVRWYAARRSLGLTIGSLARIAEAHDVTVVHPLCDPGFLAALAVAGGRSGIGDRTVAMAALFRGLLPPSLLGRTSKASFRDALVTERTRAFVEAWDGSGLDPEVIDLTALLAHWRTPAPWATSASLLQVAWLHGRRAGSVNPASRA